GTDATSRRGFTLTGQHPHSLACRTSPVRAVEAEGSRLDFGKAELAVGTGKAAAEEPIAPQAAFFMADDAASIPLPQRQLDRLEEARPQSLLDDDAVDDDVDVVRLRFLKLRRRGGIDDGAIYAGTHEAFTANLLEQLAMHSLFAVDERRQNHRLAPGFE